MKGLRIFLVIGLLLFATGMRASAPPRAAEFDLSIDELQPTLDAVQVVSIDIVSVENMYFVSDYTYLQEGWTDDYSVISAYSIMTDELSLIAKHDYTFNRFTASVELELWLIKNEDSPFLNTDYKPPVVDRPRTWIDYDSRTNLYSYSRPYYNPGTSFFMIC